LLLVLLLLLLCRRSMACCYSHIHTWQQVLEEGCCLGDRVAAPAAIPSHSTPRRCCCWSHTPKPRGWLHVLLLWRRCLLLLLLLLLLLQAGPRSPLLLWQRLLLLLVTLLLRKAPSALPQGAQHEAPCTSSTWRCCCCCVAAAEVLPLPNTRPYCCCCW
jgi:hypothetical protein